MTTPDHTPDLVALIEGLKVERDFWENRENEALKRALAVEAERDVMRERAERAEATIAQWGEREDAEADEDVRAMVTAMQSRMSNAEIEEIFADMRRIRTARALTAAEERIKAPEKAVAAAGPWIDIETRPLATGEYLVGHRGHQEIIWFFGQDRDWAPGTKFGWQKDPSAFGATHCALIFTPAT